MKKNTCLPSDRNDKLIPTRPLNTVRLASLEHTPGAMKKSEYEPTPARPLNKKKLTPLTQKLGSTNATESVYIPVLPLSQIKLKPLSQTLNSAARVMPSIVTQAPILSRIEQNEGICQGSLDDLFAENLNGQTSSLLHGTPVSCGDDPTPYSEQHVDGVIQWEHFDDSIRPSPEANQSLNSLVIRQNFVSRVNTPEASAFEKKNVSQDDKKSRHSMGNQRHSVSSPNQLLKSSPSQVTNKSKIIQHVHQAKQADYLYSEALLHSNIRSWSPAIGASEGYCPIDPVEPCKQVTPFEPMVGHGNQSRQQTSSHSSRMFTPSNKRQQLKEENRAQRSSLTVNPSSHPSPSGHAANAGQITFSPPKTHGQLEIQSIEEGPVEDKKLGF